MIISFWPCKNHLTNTRYHERGKKKRYTHEKKRWEDNMNKWTGLEFANSQRAAENRKRWRELVAKLSMMISATIRMG